MGGIERLLIDISRSMVRKGHTVYLCVINEDYTPSLLEEVDPGVQMVLLHRKPGTSLLQASLRFARFAAAHHIDVLHCQGLNCVLFSAPAILARPRMAVLNTVHDKGDYTSYYPRRTIFLAERLLDHTVAISDSVREEILSVSPHPEKVTTIYNAIDTDKFCLRNTGSPASASLSDRGADWKKQPLVIGNVARFLPEKKGQDLLVQAVEKLLSEFPALSCRFAGDIAPGQQDIYDELQTYIREHHLQDHVCFCGNVNDIPAFLHSLDAFALPSRYEGFGIALIEAMACGLPCTASRLDGPAEIITDDSLGLLFTPGDVSALADSIRTLLLRRHAGQWNEAQISASILARFSMDSMVSAHLSLYAKLLSGSR